MSKTTPAPRDHELALVCLMAHGACEFIATFALLMVVMGSFAWLVVPLVAPSMQTPALAGLVGITIAVLVRSPIGKMSGAHLNPAISLAFWMQRQMNIKELLVYVLMQVAGAIAACIVLTTLLHSRFESIGFGVLGPAAGVSLASLLIFEACATGGLVIVLFYVLSHQSLTRYAAVSVSLYLAAMTLLLAPLTGASFNPARAYAAALAAHQLQGVWPYCVAPLVGAALASGLYNIVAWLPNPRYHRLNPSHDHINYTKYTLKRIAGFWAS